MRVSDVVALVGHEVHVARFREGNTLLRWLGDVDRARIIDVAGGDGYWAGKLRRRGADAVAIDLARGKLRRGRRLRNAPALVAADALDLPFPDASFDAVMSVCAIEHFAAGDRALDEMARVLRPGGTLVMSADSLSRGAMWPRLMETHCRRYAVKETYSHDRLSNLMKERNLEVLQYSYQFRSRSGERLYLALAKVPLRFIQNAAALLTPLVALSDRWAPNAGGAVVLIRARRQEVVGGTPAGSSQSRAAADVRGDVPE